MELPKKEFDRMRARQSDVDVRLIFTWLRDDGEIRIVPDVVPTSKDAHLEGKVEALEPATK